MNGIHDLGGMHGFGPVERERDEPVFHADWEPAVVAIQRALTRGGLCTIDEFRHAIERMEPVQYLGSTYYERWLDGLCRLVQEKGMVAQEELAARTSRLQEGSAPAPAPGAHAGPAAPAPGGRDVPEPPEPSYRRTPEQPPRFPLGATVVARNDHPSGHTRLPRYARGKRGVVVGHYGTQVFPDTTARGLGEQPQPLYCVRFAASELWGPGAEANEAVHLDLWESYLLPG